MICVSLSINIRINTNINMGRKAFTQETFLPIILSALMYYDENFLTLSGMFILSAIA